MKYLKAEDSGVYECVVENSLGRTSVLYRLKVLPSFITSTLTGDLNKEASNLNMKVNNTSSSNRSRKSVLESQHWSGQNKSSLKLESKESNNRLDNTILNLRNVTIERLGQKATLRCVCDGTLAQPHFKVSMTNQKWVF